MKTVGIYGGHDQGIAVAEDGKIVLSIEEE